MMAKLLPMPSPRPDSPGAASIRRKSLEQLAKRSRSSAFSYFVLAGFIVACTPLWRDHRPAAVLLLSVSFAIAVWRAGIAARLPGAASPDAWGRSFTSATLLSAALWSAFAVYAERVYGYSWTAWLTYFCTAGLCSGAVHALSSSPRTAYAYLGVMLVPGAASLAFRGGPEGYGLSAIFAAFLAFLCMQARIYGAEFRDLILARDLAEASSRAKSAFLTSVGHELRTPLNPVIGLSRILLRNSAGRLDSKEVSYLESIHDNGKRLLSVIDGILSFTTAEAGKVELSDAPFDAAAMLRETAEPFEAPCRAKGLDLVLEVPGGVREMRGDAARLSQVVAGLMDNAIKFTERGQVRVRLAARDGVPAAIEVADTGIGIPEDKQAEVFEPFRQLDQGTGRAYAGAGLGLALAKVLAEAMGHSLELESRPGAGSTFRVRLGIPKASP